MTSFGHVHGAAISNEVAALTAVTGVACVAASAGLTHYGELSLSSYAYKHQHTSTAYTHTHTHTYTIYIRTGTAALGL